MRVNRLLHIFVAIVIGGLVLAIVTGVVAIGLNYLLGYQHGLFIFVYGTIGVCLVGLACFLGDIILDWLHEKRAEEE